MMNTRLRLIIGGVLIGIALTLAHTTRNVQGESPTPDSNRPREASGIEFTAHVPSPQGTGQPTGTLAVKVYAPSAGGERYSEGAPVMVYVPGGDSTGSLGRTLRLLTDTVKITFLFPGGCSAPALCSDGTYDHRGARSIAALRDVAQYAAGLRDDAMGKTLSERLSPTLVLTDNVGLLGSSNGGNIVIAVAALHGTSLRPGLRYIIQWESPVSSQMATVDLGPARLACWPGRESVWSVNPRYQAYHPLTVTVDHSQLAFTDTNPDFPVFWDGTGDGVYSTVPLSPTCDTPDLNGDGILSMNEDHPLGTYTDGIRDYYSRPATEAMAERGVFPGPWPPAIGTPAQASAYWDLREAVRLYPSATLQIPQLAGMVLASTHDHVQIAPDRPHIHQAFDGWQAAGAWVRINPDLSYAIAISAGLSSRTHMPNQAPNRAPTDWSADEYTYPDDLDAIYQAASVHEMADRVRNDRWYTLFLPLMMRG